MVVVALVGLSICLNGPSRLGIPDVVLPERARTGVER